jgi:hypothetical protein
MMVSLLANTGLYVAGRRMAPWYEERRAGC